MEWERPLTLATALKSCWSRGRMKNVNDPALTGPYASFHGPGVGAGAADDMGVGAVEGSDEAVVDGIGGSASEALAAAKAAWSGQVTFGEPALEVSKAQPPIAV